MACSSFFEMHSVAIFIGMNKISEIEGCDGSGLWLVTLTKTDLKFSPRKKSLWKGCMEEQETLPPQRPLPDSKQLSSDSCSCIPAANFVSLSNKTHIILQSGYPRELWSLLGGKVQNCAKLWIIPVIYVLINWSLGRKFKILTQISYLHVEVLHLPAISRPAGVMSYKRITFSTARTWHDPSRQKTNSNVHSNILGQTKQIFFKSQLLRYYLN